MEQEAFIANLTQCSHRPLQLFSSDHLESFVAFRSFRIGHNVDDVKDIDTAAAAVVLALDFGGSDYDHGFSFVSVFGDFEVDDLEAEDGFFGVEDHSGGVNHRRVGMMCRHLLVNDLLTRGVD